MARRREDTLKGRDPSMDVDDLAGQKAHESEESIHDGDSLDSKEMSPPEKILTLEAELIQANAKADEHYERLQRLQADFDNYRKRTQKEKMEIIKYASERVIGELLPVLDNFDRAISVAQVKPDFSAFSQGVEMILRQLQTALSKEGLKAIEALGEPFDPNLHDAVLRVESEEHPENTVVEEMLKGYYLNEKVIRASMVKVSN